MYFQSILYKIKSTVYQISCVQAFKVEIWIFYHTFNVKMNLINVKISTSVSKKFRGLKNILNIYKTNIKTIIFYKFQVNNDESEKQNFRYNSSVIKLKNLLYIISYTIIN